MNKRIKRTAVSRWMAMTAAALTLGACSQSEETVEMLPEGKYPIELTATGLEPTVTPMTRATVDGNWEGVTKVAVQVDGVVKEYSVDATGSADKTAAVLKSDTDPFYWKSTAAIKVSAWWPYSATKPATVALVADQSDEAKYQESDQIEAVDQNVTYTAPTLKFTHRTAKVCVNVVSASNAAMAVDGVTVSLGSNVITPYNPADGNYRCLIPGGTATDANKLSVKITIDGATYVYTHPSAYTFDANKQYTFTLTVKRDGIQLNGCTISAWETVEEVKGEAKQPSYDVVSGVWHIYNAEGLKAWADAVKESSDGNISAILENDIEMPALADGETSNWTPVGKSYEYGGTFDGNGKTISGLVVNEQLAGFTYKIKAGGAVKNLTLKDARIEGTSSRFSTGAVAAQNDGTIENCRVAGNSVIVGDNAGGVVGTNNGIILACSVAKECGIGGKNLGGIASHNNNMIEQCYALCALIGGDMVGGICYASGDNSTITECYSICQYIGTPTYYYGIVVSKGNEIQVNNCYYSNVAEGFNGTIDGASVKYVDNDQWFTEEVVWSSYEGRAYVYQATNDLEEPYKIVKQQ